MIENNKLCWVGNFCTCVHEWAIIKLVRSGGLQMCKMSFSSWVLARTLDLINYRIPVSAETGINVSWSNLPIWQTEKWRPESPLDSLFSYVNWGWQSLLQKVFLYFKNVELCLACNINVWEAAMLVNKEKICISGCWVQSLVFSSLFCDLGWSN